MELLKYVKVRSVANFLSNSTTQFYNYQYLYKTTPSATVLYKLKSQKSSLEKNEIEQLKWPRNSLDLIQRKFLDKHQKKVSEKQRLITTALVRVIKEVRAKIISTISKRIYII